MSSKLEIQLVHSPIGCPPDQRQTVLRGLGLKKLQAKRLVTDTPQMRGMLAKVAHLVSVKPHLSRENG